jgi:hypothetical protein
MPISKTKKIITIPIISPLFPLGVVELSLFLAGWWGTGLLSSFSGLGIGGGLFFPVVFS